VNNKINWVVRINNKQFWLSIIPAALLLIQTIAALLGFTIDLTDVQGKLIAIVDALFVVLTILGIVNDPTTHGIGDSMQAMGYEIPRKG